MKTYSRLAIDNPDDLIFGTAPDPVTTRSGIVIGGGRVYPELNFTLPPMTLDEASFPKVREHYEQIVEAALERAADLFADGVVLEFETLPPMTSNPTWGTDLCKVLLEGMKTAEAKYGLRSVLRMTPNDNREMVRPPRMQSGAHWDAMLELFDRSAAAGAELLSIESVGGKELHDEALTLCDLRGVIFALCVLGARDMEYLWTHIVDIAARNKVHAAGDTACGFGNTAMVLAEKRMIPRVFAAVVRSVTAVRSLVAYRCGAVGPGKDCGYENPILKAVTGCPMSMEGKSAACAHLSPLGNIAAATCDLWSNESVQNIRLLSGMAPTCSMEQLIYDCRLMNRAAADGPPAARTLRDWLSGSDAPLDSQAYILTPENVIRLARVLVEHPTPYDAGRAIALETIDLIEEGCAADAVTVPEREVPFLDIMRGAVEDMPDDEEVFIESMRPEVDDSKCVLEDYLVPSGA